MELREAHFRAAREFLRQARERGYGDLSDYYWYHTVDLGNGLVDSRQLRLPRRACPSSAFPADMHGMRVLDVGAATGFFSFEFERRGADVVSVEMASFSDLDVFPGEDIDRALRKIKDMMRGHSTFSSGQEERIFPGKDSRRNLFPAS